MSATSPDTVTEAVELLTAEGYTHDFNASLQDGGLLGCAACGTASPLGALVVERQYRFEGASDPDDEDIVVGVRCPACGARGIVTSAFGPDADPEVLAWLRRPPA